MDQGADPVESGVALTFCVADLPHPISLYLSAVVGLTVGRRNHTAIKLLINLFISGLDGAPTRHIKQVPSRFHVSHFVLHLPYIYEHFLSNPSQAFPCRLSTLQANQGKERGKKWRPDSIKSKTQRRRLHCHWESTATAGACTCIIPRLGARGSCATPWAASAKSWA